MLLLLITLLISGKFSNGERALINVGAVMLLIEFADKIVFRSEGTSSAMFIEQYNEQVQVNTPPATIVISGLSVW